LTITVVIFAVTDLVVFFGGATLNPLSAFTGLLSGTTCGFTAAGKFIINLSVTVVIFSVTDLGLWLGNVTFAHLPILAGLGSTATDRLTGLRGDVFVCFAITVVIFTIADLSLGFDLSDTHT
tara:strand:- start:38711 stop:39076 length:366 start_codon:yes stop_codon:yes gene_type:complete